MGGAVTSLMSPAHLKVDDSALIAAAARTHLFAGTSRTAAASLLNAAGAAALLSGADGRVYESAEPVWDEARVSRTR